MRTETLYSIGYEQATIEAFHTDLRELEISLLIDVRMFPQSRKPGFSMRQLQDSLPRLGIRYELFRNLGNPKHNRQRFRDGKGVDWYKANIYDMLPSEDWDHLLELLDKHRKVAVMCFCGQHHYCHRKILIQDLLFEYPGLRNEILSYLPTKPQWQRTEPEL